MSGESKKQVTDRKTVKERFRGVFVTLSAEAKAFPGGITELARLMGKNPTVLANRLNPNLLDAHPTIEDFLDCVELLQAVRTINAVAGLANHVAVSVDCDSESPHDVTLAFMEAATEIGAFISHMSTSLADGHLDSQERATALSIIDRSIPKFIGMRAVLRG